MITTSDSTTETSEKISEFSEAKVTTSSETPTELETGEEPEPTETESKETKLTEIEITPETTTGPGTDEKPEPTDTPPPESTKIPAAEDLDEFSNVEITTSSDSSVASKLQSTDNISDFILDHLPIEIGKEVKWQQTVTFTEEAQFAEIEVPSDAEFTSVSKLDGAQIPLESISDVLEISSASFRATLI